MKIMLLIVVLIFKNVSLSAQTKAPDVIVEEQIAAYNARDLELFCSFYANGIRYVELKDDLSTTTLMDGKDDLRKNFETTFKNNPAIQCTAVEKMVQGNKVIVKERFTGRADNKNLEVVFIYVVTDEKITNVARVKKRSE
jgi:hypothetical protein